ncbi:MAG: hypothetical protein E6040_13130, partial [Lachnospiraceae bacterium]|nr:hypothetical protein [Lachnospiraceae bacterium]
LIIQLAFMIYRINIKYEVIIEKVSNMKGFFELAEEKGLERGLELGRTEGADMVSELNTILAREGNLEKIMKANTDKVYRNELLKKYRLLK